MVMYEQQAAEQHLWTVHLHIPVKLNHKKVKYT